jgi:hypothetical protein
MKIWKNEAGNWCFEMEHDEREAVRLSFLVSEGRRAYKKYRRESPMGYLSALLFDRILSTVFVGSNYTGDFGTLEKPKVYRAKDMAKSLLAWRGKLPEDLTDSEYQMLEENLDGLQAIL